MGRHHLECSGRGQRFLTMKRIVGRRIVEVGTPKMALLVTVFRRWPWQTEEFYSENEIGVQIGDGVLTVTMTGDTRSYNATQWKKVISKTIPSRSRV